MNLKLIIAFLLFVSSCYLTNVNKLHGLLDHAVCILIKVAKRRKKSYKDSFPKAIW